MKTFTPSSSALLAMIASAEARCDADVDQWQRRREAREDARRVDAWFAEVQARRARRLRETVAVKPSHSSTEAV